MTAPPDLDQHLAPARRLPAGAPAFVHALRERGMARFAALGFPTTKVEDWKYTNIVPIARETFTLAPERVDGAAELAASAPDVVLAPPPALAPVPGARLVAVDPGLATLPLLDLPARVRALHAALYPPPAGDAEGGALSDSSRPEARSRPR